MRRFRSASPREAADLGIEIVYQDLALADNLDVVQNMFLGREELESGLLLDETKMEARSRETLASLSVTTIRSVRQTVAGLSGGQRQSVAVAKAVMWNSRLVILDEPTAALGVAQTRQVLDLVRRLADQGLGVILISHNLHDIFEVADDITVLRLGQNVAEFDRKTHDRGGGRARDHSRQAAAGARPDRLERGGGRLSTAAPSVGRPAKRLMPRTAACRRFFNEWWVDVRSGELGSLPIIVGLIIIAIVFQTQNDRFLTSGNFVNLIVQSAAIAIIAMGVVFVLLLGEIDLSVGYVSASPAWSPPSS